MGNGFSTGMQIGRDRNQGTDKYTYWGQDNQTQPLSDLGYKTTDWLNQLFAQNNYLFGGKGYGGAYGKAAPPATPMGGGGGGYYGSPSAAGPKAAQGGGNMANARMAGGGGPNPYNPHISANPAIGVDHGGDYAGDAPGYGDTTGDWYNEGTGDQGGGPNGINQGLHFNYLPGVDHNDGYFPRDPSILNDGDNARPSPIKPQGSSTDPWSSPLGAAQGPPTGGIVGEYDQFATGGPTDYESQVGQGALDMYGNPMSPYDDQAGDIYANLGSGALTGNESQTRGLLLDRANGPTSGPLADLMNGVRNANEGETRDIYRDLGRGAAGATATELEDRDAWKSLLSDLGTDGSGIFGSVTGAGGGGGAYSMGPAGGIGAGSAFAGAKGAYDEMLKSEGFDPATREAIMRDSLEGQRGVFDSAKADLLRRRAMSGAGTAGFYGALQQGAADRADALGKTARGNLVDFAREKQRQREVGAAGEANLAGIEASNANAEASRAASANALASQNARAALEARIAAAQGLNAWDLAARDRQKFGATGMNAQDEAARSQQLSALGLQDKASEQALGLLSDQDARAAGRMAEGAKGLASLGDSYYGRRAKSLDQANTWADQQRKYRQYGTSGKAALYGAGQQNILAGLGQLFDIYRLPAEKYHMGGDTTGSGGFQI